MYLNQLCAVCAWRATCQKKFSMTVDSRFCPDYTRDVSLGTEDTDKPNRGKSDDSKEH